LASLFVQGGRQFINYVEMIRLIGNTDWFVRQAELFGITMSGEGEIQ